MNNYGLRCSKCSKMMGVILSDYTVNIGDKCKILCPECFIQHEGEPEILKCPCCGNLPKIYPWGGGYLCHCERYACDFYYSISAHDKANVIEGWNEAVIQYKESHNG